MSGYSLASLANVENLSYTGSGDFTGAGNAAAHVLPGGTGNDTLDGAAGADTLIGLLAATGIRIGEAINLDRGLPVGPNSETDSPATGLNATGY
ncbi:hypothetical protein WCLP8_20001 [uncultured Gammaproteobacteria bacterium]